MEKVLKKLQYKDNKKVNATVLNAPEAIEEEFLKFDFKNKLSFKSSFNFTILFIRNKSELDKHLEKTLKFVEYDSLFWIAYPKGTSKIKSDVNRDKLWDLVLPLNLRPVSQIAIDNDWSALRFRPVDKVKNKK